MDQRAESLAIGRLRIFTRCCLIWGIALVGRLIYLQIVHHEEYLELAQRQQDRQVEVQAPRGTIFDRNGEPLAMSLPVDSVCVNPLRIPDLAVAADLLSKVLDLETDQLLSRLAAARDSRRGFLWIKRKVSRQEAQRLRNYNFDWIEFRTESQRFYPKNELGALVVGSVNHEERGDAGLEQSLEHELHGTPGVIKTTSDVRQRVIDMQVFNDPIPGKNLKLTIDERIQFAGERALKAAVLSNHCKTGSVVVMNPYTGEIIAMTSYPAFNPNERPKPGDPENARTNLAVQAPFEPGSVFKVITLAAALETTRLRPETIIPCGSGRMTLFKRVIHDHDAYASLSMADVLAKSSNIGAIQVALKVGEGNLYEYIKRFGFGARTGVRLPSESAGRVHPLKRWIPSSIGSVAMGHELMTTTVQLAQAAAVIANGGLLVRPKLIIGKQRPRGSPEPGDANPEPVRIIKPETAFTMRRMMEGVVLRGTGKKAQLMGYTSAGKTGSAQIFDFKTHSYTHKYNASFMGFAPVTKPSLVIVVTLNGASKYGGAVAAPVFHEIATAALRMLDIPKDLPDGVPVDDDKHPPSDLALAELSVLDDEDAPDQQQPLADALRSETDEGAVRVPNFRGKTLRAVMEESAALGMRIETSGRGLAVGQEPLAGASLHPGERVRVQFAR